MADLLDGIARHLQDKALVSYQTASAAGDCFLESMPPTPDEAVSLTIYDDGREPDSRLGYDEPRVQVRVRGTKDPRVSRQRCAAIRDELHGLGPLTLPDGTQLILSVALQNSAASIGIDELGRHEHVANFRMEIRAVTQHRV
ncbi:minor capsid protein [Streptomyces cylindrosporus]|uniref:Minor capsid protein n=1 Tax=Streptomyces cylindrosporus TaxID=2927583 RepID=A0ABS9Y2G9_9ACTN|nr:minor capsid protein [Streptomyces cylindrosporus]MCI3271393.1 minor capsid protein [Streptomyces cylindrosporus]